MPTYMLDGAAQVGLTPRPLTVSIRLDGTSVGAALHAETTGVEVPGVVRPRSGMLIIPRISSVTTVRVAPVGMERFPAGTIAHVDVAVSAMAGIEPERAVLIPIDLSGLTTRDLFVFDTDERSVLVRAARVLPPPEDLGELGNAARITATELIGVQVVDEAVGANIVVAVDGSASFDGLVRDGSADAVVQVLAGIIEVVAPGKSYGASIVGSSATPIATGRVGTLADSVKGALTSHPQSIGLRSGTTGLLGFARSGNTVTYLLTDAVPSDIADFEAADEVDGEARHLVVLSTPSAWALQTPPKTPGTLVEIGGSGTGGASLAETLLAEPGKLRALVRSLLSGCFPPGTAEFDRVAR